MNENLRNQINEVLSGTEMPGPKFADINEPFVGEAEDNGVWLNFDGDCLEPEMMIEQMETEGQARIDLLNSALTMDEAHTIVHIFTKQAGAKRSLESMVAFSSDPYNMLRFQWAQSIGMLRAMKEVYDRLRKERQS